MVLVILEVIFANYSMTMDLFQYFDNLSLGNKWSVKWGPLEVGELCSENDLQKLFKNIILLV